MICTAGIELIKKYEGLRLISYQDVIGIWTCGYGRTKNIQEGDSCTLAQATAWLLEDIEDAENIINEVVTVQLNENQRAALTSFVFNVGGGKEGVKDGFVHLKSGGQSHLLQYVNMGAFGKASEQFSKWNKAGGFPVVGLTKRRMEEAALFML